MKLLKWLIIILALLVCLFSAVTYFLPKDYYVERSVEIQAPPLVIYSQVVDLEAWQQWNPWNNLDPDMVINFGEKTVGEGASYQWISEVTGNGKMVIIETRAPEFVRYQLEFEGYEDNPGYSSMVLSSESAVGPTTVTWTFEGEVGDKFYARWMTILMDKMLGGSYELGLADLKKRCEGMVSNFPEVPPVP